uniref:Uncharacterized protein n=1 Tax=Arundo donax TaxID=35708 RepID=A0A0A9FHV7_ARUDO
MIVNTEEN